MTLTGWLTDQEREFRAHLRDLCPFEASLADLTLSALERDGAPSLRSVLKDYDSMRRAVVREGKARAAAVVVLVLPWTGAYACDDRRRWPTRHWRRGSARRRRLTRRVSSG